MKLLTRVVKVTIAESCILKDGEEMYTKEETANIITNLIKRGAGNIDVKVESIEDYEEKIEGPKVKERKPAYINKEFAAAVKEMVENGNK